MWWLRLYWALPKPVQKNLAFKLLFVDNGVSVGTSLNRCYDTDWNTSAIKEGESELPEMIAIIERNREDRERKVVMDR